MSSPSPPPRVDAFGSEGAYNPDGQCPLADADSSIEDAPFNSRGSPSSIPETFKDSVDTKEEAAAAFNTASRLHKSKEGGVVCNFERAKAGETAAAAAAWELEPTPSSRPKSGYYSSTVWVLL